jgi:chromate transporter
MSLAGFGGVLVFARHAIVDQHRWMTADEFNEAFALCHFLPGPNIVNLSMVFGSRLRGIAGGVAAFTGLLPPTLIMTVLAIIYARFGDAEVLRRLLAGISCAAVGLLIAVVFRMMTPLLKRMEFVALIQRMTDKQFADAYAIAQLSPGPNVLIVTLIGYAVAGIPGALAATLAMCLPTALLAYYVSRLLNRPSQSRWPCADPGCTGSAVDRIDGGECLDPRTVDRPHLRCF